MAKKFKRRIVGNLRDSIRALSGLPLDYLGRLLVRTARILRARLLGSCWIAPAVQY